MVDTFGFRPYGRGSYGPLAPFGFAPQAPQIPDASSGGNGQGRDFPGVTPAAWGPYYCQNVECGMPNGGVVYPLCPQCNDRLKNGGEPILLENGQLVTKPIVPGGDDK
jgi:hypothetical protein